ncbi:stress protein [Halobacillus seohaensis]|uniref:Stress protein n=1 Tax=Halobacillus seohaensis TaxID=447421 RepID=A0ABW2EL85_9BACI
MKKLLFVLFALSLGVLVACSSTDVSNDSITVDGAIKAFQDAGLEAENATEMTKDDYGMAPMKSEEGKRFLVPSIEEGAGGRIFSFEKEEDLDQMKEYYDSLGEESAIFFSWTIKHENILVQINGDLPEEKYEEYKTTLESL